MPLDFKELVDVGIDSDLVAFTGADMSSGTREAAAEVGNSLTSVVGTPRGSTSPSIHVRTMQQTRQGREPALTQGQASIFIQVWRPACLE